MNKKKSVYKAVNSLNEVIKELREGKILYWMQSMEIEKDKEITDYSHHYCWIDTPDESGKIALSRPYYVDGWQDDYMVSWAKLASGKWYTKEEEGELSESQKYYYANHERCKKVNLAYYHLHSKEINKKRKAKRAAKKLKEQANV